jgi:hypothetical protein
LSVPSGRDADKDARDKGYFEGLVKRNPTRSETLEITLDRKLFNQILAVADTMEKDLRSGKLNSVPPKKRSEERTSK